MSNSSIERIRILVVDDWPDSADSLAELLGIMGMETKAVYSGAQAIEAASAMLPHVILMDISMPGMNGIEAAMAIRQNLNGRLPGIIALTAHGEESGLHEKIHSVFHHCIVKPPDINKLWAMILAHACK